MTMRTWASNVEGGCALSIPKDLLMRQGNPPPSGLRRSSPGSDHYPPQPPTMASSIASS